jgi:hypothetical protein
VDTNIIHMPINWVALAINAAVFFFSGLMAVITVVWKLAQHERNLRDDFTEKITAAMHIDDEKRARVYVRFDEYKNFIETSFVRRDMCNVLHVNTATEVAKTNKRMDDIERKIDELKDLIIKLNEQNNS